MKPLYLLLAAFMLAFAPVSQAQDKAAEDEYFDVYTLIRQGDTFAAKGKVDKARTNYISAQQSLRKLQADYPYFEPKVVKFRLDYLSAQLSAKPATNALPAAGSGATTAIDLAGMNEQVSAGDADQLVAFKVRWDVGKRYEEKLKLGAALEVIIPQELAGMIPGASKPAAGAKSQTMKADVLLNQDLAISVLSQRDNGGREFELKFGNTVLNVKADGKTVANFDPTGASANVLPDPDMATTLKQLSGAKLKLLTGANGQLESVEDLEEFLARVGGTNIPDAKSLVTNITPELQKSMLESAAGSGFAPDHPVKVGETWTSANEVQSEDVGSLKVAIDYTFKGWADHNQHKCAVIDLNGKFTPVLKISPDASSPVTIQAKMTGRIWYDPEQGTIVETIFQPDVQAKVNFGTAVISAKLGLQANTRLTELADLAK